MAIACVYCGGSHERADEVRACWARTNGAEVAAPEPQPATPTARRLSARPFDTHSSRPTATWWAGPEELGRHLVIRPGDEVSAPWSAAPRIVIDAAVLADPGDTVVILRAAHAARARTVIELAVPFEQPSNEVDNRALDRVGPTAELLLDSLHHLVWSNSVILDDHGAWFLAAHLAIGKGAAVPTTVVAADERPSALARPDVELPDGTGAWVDGGPLRWSPPIGGRPVVPLVAVEHGSVRPFGVNDSSAALAPDQLAAVTHPTGAARIIAPAGSGKTRVLTERARHLVRHWGLPPSAISLVAYNRRAQLEMQERLSDVAGLQVRTLNSIALAIVNGVPPFAPRPERRTTITEPEVRRVLGQFVQTPRRRSVDPLAPWLAAMSAARLGLRRAEDVEAQ